MILQLLNPNNYHFTPYSLPMLTTGVAIILLGLFVLIRERTTSVGVSFFFMCLPISLYQITAALNYSSRDISMSLLLSIIGNLGVIFIPSTILVLMTVLLGLTHRYRFVIAASIFLSILFTLGLFFTDLHIRGIERFSWGWYAQFGPLGVAFLCYFFAIMVMILRLLWQEYHRCTAERQMKRYRGLLTAFIGGYLGSVDFLAAFGIPVYPFGYVFVGFFIAISTYVILRYRLVDITPEVAAGQILETMQGAVIVTGMDGRIKVINNWALEMLGYPRSELIGRDLISVLPIPPDISSTVQTVKSVVSREMALQGRNRTYEVNISASLLDDTSIGEPIGIVYVASDITKLKEMQETLRINEERQRVALSAANQGWYDLNVRTGEVIVSPEYARLLGYDPAEFTASLQNWFAHIHPDDLPALQKAYHDCLVTGGPVTMEYRSITKSGDWIWLSSGGKIVEYDTDNKPLRMTGIHTNITERKRAETVLQDKTRKLEDLTANLEQRVQEEVSLRRKNEGQLAQQSKMAAMGEMLGAIAHQWRQPLNTLGLIVQNLKDAYAYGDMDKQYLETTVQKSMTQIQHMSKTIDDFRNFFRSDKERANFDTMQAVGHVLSLFSAQLVANSIDFQVTCRTHGTTFTRVEDIIPCQEKTIKGFRNEFEHVILNMINNAREAIIERRESGRMTGDGRGIINFNFSSNDGVITIEVGNNGVGIPESIMDRIFDPYFTTKAPSKGTGLGLYMSKVIIEDHMQGRLTAKNSDQGVAFIVELPLV
jgi:PAS domain S-box-containing protein